MSISCNSNDLIEASKCFRCVPRGMLDAVRIDLLCAWANGGGPPPTPPDPPSNLDIDLTSAADHIVLTWTNGASPGTTNEVWRSINGGAYGLFTTVAGAATTATDPGIIPNGDLWCYKVRACNGATCSAFAAPPACIGMELDYNATALAIINLPDLILHLGNFRVEGPASVNQINVPRLKKSTMTLSWNGCANLASIDITALQDVGAIGCLWSNNPLLTNLDCPALVQSDTLFAPNICGILTMTAPVFANCNGALIIDQDPIGVVSFPALTTVAGAFSAVNCPNVTSISCPLVVNIAAALDCNTCPSLVTASFPLLSTVSGGVNFQGATSLTTATFTALGSVGDYVDFSGCTSLAALSFPAMTIVTNNLTVAGSTSLVTLGLSAVTSIGGNVSGIGCTALTTINAGSWTITDGTSVAITGANLDQASVENILARGVASGITTCTIDLSGGTSTGFAALSAGGQADYLTLTGAGNVVTLNP